jgi:hypothetical protein
MNDVAGGWPVYIVCTIISLIIGYFYLLFIRIFGGFILVLSWLQILTAFLCGGFYTYYFAREKFDTADAQYAYLTLASYFLWALCVLTFMGGYVCYNYVKLGIAVFKATAQYLGANMRIILVPTVVTVITLFWGVIWLVAAVWIYAVGTPEPRYGFPFITEIKWEESTRGAFAFHIFGFLWVNAFMIGCTQFIIGASACIWYFEVETDTKGKGTILRALKWLSIYHWGSVAYGSCIIATC